MNILKFKEMEGASMNTQFRQKYFLLKIFIVLEFENH